MRQPNVYASGKYFAHYLDNRHYQKNNKHFARLRFLVFDPATNTHEDVCSDPPLTITTQNAFDDWFMEAFGATPAELRNTAFEVTIIENCNGLNSVVSWELAPDYIIPPAIREFMCGWHTPEYLSTRKSNDPKFARQCQVRDATRRVLRGGTDHNDLCLLGCGPNQLRDWIEIQFVDGMDWDNYGDWEIDHEIPLSRVNLLDHAELQRVAFYQNLRPLWKSENRARYNAFDTGNAVYG